MIVEAVQKLLAVLIVQGGSWQVKTGFRETSWETSI